MSLELQVGSATDVGRVRTANEDSFAVVDDLGLAIVADGMGGHQAGEVASAAAVATVIEGVRNGLDLDAAITAANTTVFEQASADPELHGMGTTLTAARLVGDDTVILGHVGDSRAYLWRDDQLEQLTADHSLVAELIAAGALTEEEAERDPRRSMITRALGIDATVEVDISTIAVRAGDRLLLCSDGLTGMVRADALADTLTTVADPSAAAQQLVAAANEAGGVDNITAVIIDIVDPTLGWVDDDPDATQEVPVVAVEEPRPEESQADESLAEEAPDSTETPEPEPEPEAPRRRGLFGRRARRGDGGAG